MENILIFVIFALREWKPAAQRPNLSLKIRGTVLWTAEIKQLHSLTLAVTYTVGRGCTLPVTPIVQRRCTPSWCGNKADALTLSTMSLFHSLCPLCRCFTHSVPYVAVSFTLSTMSLFHSLCPLCRCFTHSVHYVAVSLILSTMSLFHSLSPLCRCFTLSTMSLFHSLCPLCHCFIHSVH